MMPVLKPLAGFSPICNVVLAHIEHCADAETKHVIVKKADKNNIIRRRFIIRAKVVSNQ